MQSILKELLTAKAMSVALVVEVGFIIGVFAGRTDMNAFQWGGAAMAVVGAVMLAAIVFSWPEPAKPADSRQPARRT